MKIQLLLLLLATTLAVRSQTIKNVDAATFKQELEKGDAVLIDLRTDDEIERKGMIKGAIQIDYFAKDAEPRILKLNKDKKYLVYCAGGGRSTQCGELMEKNGFKSIVNLEKGYDDWKKKGFETVQRAAPVK